MMMILGEGNIPEPSCSILKILEVSENFPLVTIQINYHHES
jgi:hypothetical protein